MQSIPSTKKTVHGFVYVLRPIPDLAEQIPQALGFMTWSGVKYLRNKVGL